MNISLQRFNLEDLSFLEEIMALNKESAGDRPKDYRKFIQWNINHDDDPYWKIVEEDSNKMIGYIGYAQALYKPTTKNESSIHDLFLEIYLHPDYTGMGIGEKAWNLSLNLLPKIKRKIFASTYISNIKAQGFFSKKLAMKVSHYNKRFNVVVYVIEK